jgi:diguanylate cyclase (GGDEF)-like protein
MQSDRMLFEELGKNDQKLVLKKLNDSEMLIIIINSNEMDKLLNTILKVTIGLTLLAGATILIINFWMIRKYGALLDVERERLDLAKSFQRTIQSMPAMLFHCYKNEMDEIVLSYNDGRYFTQDELVLSDSDHVKMDTLYAPDFMEKAEPHILKAFNHTKSRFEAEHGGRFFDIMVSPVYDTSMEDGEKKVKEIIGFGSEISDRVNRTKEAEYLATHDMLTGLPNRASFIECLEENIQREEELYIIYFDLDKFKEINDTHGHQVGDEVLKVIASRFRLYANDAFKIARLGGDEFVAQCIGLDLDDVKHMTTRIVETISTPIEINNIVSQVGVSAGIAGYPENGTTGEKLIVEADRAMYKRKKSGGNGFHIG